MDEWRYIFDVRKGRSHEERGTECQDKAYALRGELCVVAALADGLGSLPYSATAADAAVRAVCEWFVSRTREQLDNIFADAQSESESAALREKLTEETAQAVRREADFLLQPWDMMNCTLVFVCVAFYRNQALAGRIGDSAVCCIRGDGMSETMTARGLSANRTDTLLGGGAADKLELRVYNLSDASIGGFLLVSDGLSNEVYMKGSSHVCHDAQEYFNSLCGETEETALAMNAQTLDALSENRPRAFKDDMSYAVLSRAKAPIAIPENPMWLCSCGTRNELWETYCRGCHMDFVNLYGDIDFTKTEKAAYFSRKGAKSAETSRFLDGFPRERGAPARLIPRLLLLIALLLILIWNILSLNAARKEIRALSARMDAVEASVEKVKAGAGAELAPADEWPVEESAEETAQAGAEGASMGG